MKFIFISPATYIHFVTFHGLSHGFQIKLDSCDVAFSVSIV